MTIFWAKLMLVITQCSQYMNDFYHLISRYNALLGIVDSTNTGISEARPSFLGDVHIFVRLPWSGLCLRELIHDDISYFQRIALAPFYYFAPLTVIIKMSLFHDNFIAFIVSIFLSYFDKDILAINTSSSRAAIKIYITSFTFRMIRL